MRNICVCQEFLTEAHKAQIRDTAERLGFAVRFFEPDRFEEAKACLQDCEILYAHSPDLLRAAPSSLKWYCCSYAGVDPYCKDPALFANPDCMLTNSNCYGVTISEHVIMVLLMFLRNMPGYMETARNRVWGPETPIRSIRNNRFTILGTGDIGRNIAERLRGMGAARVTGLNRSGGAAGDAFDQVLPIGRLDEILPQAEYLIMALPGTAETRHILNRARIALLPRGAYVVNVGRGTAIEQEPLIEALNTGVLGGAALDVMDPEPLPPDHPLWRAKNLILTPHVSGNMTLGYTCNRNVEMFCRDLENYAAGRPLESLIDRTRGY